MGTISDVAIRYSKGRMIRHSRRGMTLLRRETPAFAQQKWPGGTLYHYGLCELAQRQAVLMRQNKSQGRAIKSDRAKVVMTAGCISKIFDISNYIYILKEIGNSINQNLEKNILAGKIPTRMFLIIFLDSTQTTYSKASLP